MHRLDDMLQPAAMSGMLSDKLTVATEVPVGSALRLTQPTVPIPGAECFAICRHEWASSTHYSRGWVQPIRRAADADNRSDHVGSSLDIPNHVRGWALVRRRWRIFLGDMGRGGRI